MHDARLSIYLPLSVWWLSRYGITPEGKVFVLSMTLGGETGTSVVLTRYGSGCYIFLYFFHWIVFFFSCFLPYHQSLLHTHTYASVGIFFLDTQLFQQHPHHRSPHNHGTRRYHRHGRASRGDPARSSQVYFRQGSRGMLMMSWRFLSFLTLAETD